MICWAWADKSEYRIWVCLEFFTTRITVWVLVQFYVYVCHVQVSMCRSLCVLGKVNERLERVHLNMVIYELGNWQGCTGFFSQIEQNYSLCALSHGEIGDWSRAQAAGDWQSSPSTIWFVIQSAEEVGKFESKLGKVVVCLVPTHLIVS